MSDFKQILKDFDSCLKAYNEISYNLLEPSLGEENIIKLFSAEGFYDDNVLLLYKWKNGISNEDNRCQIFEFGCTQLSLVESFWYKRNFPIALNEYLWPFFAFANDDVFLFNSQPGNDYGKIHLFSVSLLSIDDPYSYYDSLESMLNTTIELYKAGGLKYNTTQNRVMSDIGICQSITKQMNPKSNFHTDKYP